MSNSDAECPVEKNTVKNSSASGRGRHLFLFLCFCASMILFPGCTQGAPETERFAATRVLSEYLAQAASPKGVLVISNPFTQQPGRPAEVYAFEEAGIEGVRKVFEEQKVPVTVAHPKLKEEVIRDPSSVPVDPKTTTPLSFLVAEHAFSEVIRENPNCDLVISLIGLPVNLSGMNEWSQAGGPKFALLLPDWRMIGGSEEIKRVFREKKLIAAVVNKPDTSGDGQASGDYREIFENKFLLVTAKNIEKLLAESPEVFGLR